VGALGGHIGPPLHLFLLLPDLVQDHDERLRHGGQHPRDHPGVAHPGRLRAGRVLAVVHLFQAIGFLPYFIGPVAIRDFSLWYSLMWLLMIYVWIWAIRALLDMDPSAWMFVLVVSGFSVIFDFFTIMGTPTTTTDVSVSFLVGVAILGYTLLPSTKRAFAIR